MSTPTLMTTNPGQRPQLPQGGGFADTLPVNSEWAELQYAGVEFGPFTTVDEYQVEPVFDERGNKSYNRFTLTCSSTLIGGGVGGNVGVDSLAIKVRRSLTTPRGLLVLSGRAVGRMVVNDGVTIDIKNGPIPTVVSWDVRGENASRIHWTLTWCLPDCPDAVYTSELGTLSHTYTVSTQVDNGYTTRTISGKVVIPQNRAKHNARLPADTADKFFYIADGQPGSIMPVMPPGFRRSYSSSLNEDRSTLSYTVTDTQIGRQAPPPGCLTADESYALSTQQVGGFFQWVATIDTRYELPIDGDINNAADAFFTYINDKLDFMLRMLGEQDPGPGKPRLKGYPSTILPLSFSMGEPEVRGRRVATFSFSFSFVTGLMNVLRQSGIWQQVSNGNWQTWYNSISFVMNPLGSAGLTLNASIDTIVDLCHPSPLDLGNFAPGIGTRPAMLEPGKKIRLSAPAKKLQTSLEPKVGQDWVSYRTWFEIVTDDGVAKVTTLPAAALNGDTDLIPDNAFNGAVSAAVLGAIGGIGAGTSGGTGVSGVGGLTPPPAVIGSGGTGGGIKPPGLPTPAATGILDRQDTGVMYPERRTLPHQEVFFCGEAARYGTPVPAPALAFITFQDGSQVGVVRAQRPEDGPPFGQVSFPLPNIWGGDPVPLYTARWRMRYITLGEVKPGNVIKDPPNPMTGAGM